VASFDEVVPPGKVATLKASIHTANYHGPISKQVTITHDDKSQGSIVLNVAANIVSSVEILPSPALQLARRRRGFENPALLIVRKDATETGTFAFSDLTASAPWLKISSRRVTTDEPPLEGIPAARPGDVVLSVQAAATAPFGSHAEKVTFKTGLPREPLVTIPVTVFVQPPVSVQSRDLILIPTPGAPETATGQVLGSIRDDVDPKAVAVSSDAPAFSARVELAGARAFRLVVDWSGTGKHPKTATVVHIRAGSHTIDLPVRVNLPQIATPS
jgi:hypothetical protein